MYVARFELERLTVGALEHLCEALFQIDFDHLEKHRDTPPLYRSGVRYLGEPIGSERWLPVPVVLGRLAGDCEDLAMWRRAELVRQGVRAMTHIEQREVRLPGGNTGTLYHIAVLLPNGIIEDPSVRLGMPRPRGEP